MTWHLRFRRRLRLVPGVWLNVARRDVSVSAGIRGLTFNSRGRRTVSLPGTGLSASTTSSRRREVPGQAEKLKVQVSTPLISTEQTTRRRLVLPVLVVVLLLVVWMAMWRLAP